MSWNTSGLFIHSELGRSLERCFEVLGASGARLVENVSFDEAASTSLNGTALAVVDGWTLLFDALLFMSLGSSAGTVAENEAPSLEERLQTLSREHEIITFLLSGVSDTFGFSRFRDGQQVRDFLTQQGNEISQVGAPSETEQRAFAQADNDEEQAILALVEELSLSWDTIAAAEFAVYELNDF